MKRKPLSRFWKFYWLVMVLTSAIYLTMVFWSLPKISAMAGGLLAFDLLPFGYSVEYARSFLTALYNSGPDAVAFYLNVQHGLDLAFPALSGFLFWATILRFSRGMGRSVRIVFAMLPVIGTGFDYAENIRVAGMLRKLPGLPFDSEVYGASLMTILKSGFVTAAMVVMIVLIAKSFLGGFRFGKSRK